VASRGRSLARVLDTATITAATTTTVVVVVAVMMMMMCFDCFSEQQWRRYTRARREPG